MKPSNKNGSQKGSKINGTEKNSSAKINDYYKIVPNKKQIVTKKRCNVSEVKEFYIQALKVKLKSYDANVENESHTSENENRTSENENRTTENELNHGACALVPETGSGDDNNEQDSCDRCKHWEKKYKDLKRVHLKLTFNYSELDMKFKDLTETSANTVHSDIDDAVSTDGIFTLSELKKLELIPLDKTKDSTFILNCLRYAYKENPSSLLNKTLKGTLEWTEVKEDGSDEFHPGKDPLTPEKVTRIKELFVQRLSKCNINSAEYGERVQQSKINKLFASGIKNVAKTQK